jgi:beta-lactamase class A
VFAHRIIRFKGNEKMKTAFLLILVLPLFSYSQNVTIPAYFHVDSAFSAQLHSIVADLGLDKDFDVGEDGIEQISFAVVDFTSGMPRLGGVRYENFIYPASVYKMYVGAEVLDQVSQGKYFLSSPFIVKSPNDVDKSPELAWDPRPLLKNGDTVTVNYLLDLMITRSDNSAANCLIDLARRENINALIHKYGWNGSEVTRKFLSRAFEDSGYATIRGTETCALHAADFMYRIYTNQLVNPWVSMQMKALLGRQLDTTKLSTGLPANVMFYHKTGWYSYWTNDVGIVDDGTVRYVIACFLPIEEDMARPKMKILSNKVYELIREKNGKE